jgi:hypothetical protein
LYELYCFDNPDRNINALYDGANIDMIGNDGSQKGSFLGSMDDGMNNIEGDGINQIRSLKTKPKGTVSLNNINSLTDPNDTETVLEYILITISQSMGLSPKQAAGLLSNN